MFRFVFLFLLDFSCLFLCEGAVFGPSNRTNLIFMSGSTEKLEWSFTDDISGIVARIWTFTPSDGRMKLNLARIFDDGEVQVVTTSYEVAVEKPATLVLKNINLTYDGTYQFSLSPGASPSDVVVYIAVKPNATACPNPITVNEGGNVSCTCQGLGGNPPADVAWYKDNLKISETGKEEKTLTLTNVTNEKDHKGYKCVAQSHPNETFRDEVTVKVKVRPKCKPNKTEIEVPEEAHLGEKLVINCSSDGLPPPSFTITHNVTSNIVSKDSKYIKEYVDYSDAGMYKCIAKNVLGNDTDSGFLTVKDKRPSTKLGTNVTPTQSIPSQTTDGVNGVNGVSPGLIAGICIAVLLLLVIVIVVYCCYKKKEKDARSRGNIDRPIGGNHYELDDEEPIEGDNAYDTLVTAASGSKSSPPKSDTFPPVYAAVDKENRQGNTLYASVDTDAMKPKRESKKERAERAPQTEYASIDFKKTAEAAKAEPV